MDTSENTTGNFAAEPEILDDAALARRWHIEGTPQAVAKRFDRLSNKKRAAHLKSFKCGKKRLYRLQDVREFESRAKNFTLSLAGRPSAVNEWIQLAKLAGLDEEGEATSSFSDLIS